MTLLINSIAHLLVDGVSCSVLFSAEAGGAELTAAILIYNTLAFSGQCVVGYILDRIGNSLRLARISMLIVALAWFLPIGVIPKAVVAGIGNSVFHVAGGIMTMLEYRGRAKELGLFVAPGAIGVSLGVFFSHLGVWLACGLIACAALIGFSAKGAFLYNESPTFLGKSLRRRDLPVSVAAFLTAAVAVRAVGGSAVSFPWKTGVEAALIMTLFVFAGKAAGGFVCDRIGAVRTAYISIVPAAILVAFFSAYMVPSLAGQFLLNLTMPVTLWLLYEAMPDSPGLAFGLAAAALWPGSLIGGLFQLTGPALWACVIMSFCFGLVAIILCERKISK